MTEGAQWAGQPIKLETEFIITQRMVQSLALAGATLDDVVHAQVYLTDREDYSAFNEAWYAAFRENRGRRSSIIPCIAHGLAPYDGKIEINVLAAKPGGAAQKRQIDAGVPTAFRHQPQAVKAGDLLFMSGLMAIDGDGPGRRGRRRSAPAAVRLVGRRRRPNTSSATSRSSAEAAGTSLANVVRVLQFHTDIANSIRSTRSGSAGSAAARCRSPRSRCPRRCRCRARP